ncbi:MAG: Membrane-bound lytic murein transglycosylase B [Rhodocyclaceae bacterium]|nr:lytic murein transglycosylase B [Rhodocyclaceae bacterium]MCG3187603.1 Membrane-bound lytic murein transglycosylase B [Rhodocyclaceae bacterium]
MFPTSPDAGPLAPSRRRLLAGAVAGLVTMPTLLPQTALAARHRLRSSPPLAAASEGNPDVEDFIAALQAEHGFPEAQLRRELRAAEYLPDVIRAIQPPTRPGVRSWARYRARFLDEGRVRAGLEFAKDYASTLAEVSAAYGVPAEILVAILGVETYYGRLTGRYAALSALATLGFHYPPRAQLFRRELAELFLLAREQGRVARDYIGSYAGALGWPQFLPSSWRRYAVDFDQDGLRDLYHSVPDTLASIGHYLAAHGWQRGGPIAAAVDVADQAAVAGLLAAGIEPRHTAAELVAAGVRTAERNEPSLPAALIDLETPGEETEFWLGYRNFYAITRYNRSSFYAMAVHQLARALGML